MKHVQLGPLQCVVTGADSPATGPLVVLLHGFGAPGTDLVGLGGALDVPPGTRFVFPAAPLTLGAGYGDGRAWWMLDMQRLERRARGEQVDRSDEIPDGLDSALAALLQCLQAAIQRYGGPQTPVIVGGFSQGSMLACDAVLQSDIDVAGLALLSSTLIASTRWLPAMAKRAGLPVYQSHGTQDPLLPHADAVRLRDSLTSSGVEVRFVSFTGGHEIPGPVLDGLSRFITEVGADSDSPTTEAP